MIELEGYKIIREIGSGGMGSVYLAEHKHLGTKVAIKSLHKNLVNDDSFRTRFRNEARSHSKLTHANIVRLIDYKEEKDGLYLIMEYVEGKQLNHYISKNTGPIPEEKLIPLFLQILSAIEYAHKKKLIHRDIKPANILITADEEAKVLDFGVAKLQGEDHGLTKTGVQIGTVAYMSPEQVNAEKTDKLTDIYSLGVTLFQMAVGQSPYSSITNAFKIQVKIVGEPFPNAKEIYPPISDKLLAIIEKATKKNKKERYQSCEEFRKDLNNDIIAREKITEKKHIKKPSKNKSSIFKKMVATLLLVCAILASYQYIYKPYQVDRYMDMGDAAFDEENYTDALSHFTDAWLQYDLLYELFYYKDVSSVKKYDRLYFMMAECNYKLEKYDQSLKFYKWAEYSYKYNAGYYYKRGACNYELEEYSVAINDFTSAIEIDSGKSHYWLKRSECYYREKKNDLAIEGLNKISILEKDNGRYDWGYFYYIFGLCHFDKEEYSLALVSFTNSLKSKINYSNYFYRGNAYYKLNQLSEAIEDYTNSISINENVEEKTIFASNTLKNTYRNRGIARYESCERGACEDLLKACELGDKEACNEYKRIITDEDCN